MGSCSVKEQEISKVLIRLGFLSKCRVMSYKGKKVIFLKMKYVGQEPVIRSLTRVSKPGKRAYSRPSQFFKRNTSFSVLTTSKGILNSYEALVLNRGGELMFNVE